LHYVFNKKGKVESVHYWWVYCIGDRKEDL